MNLVKVAATFESVEIDGECATCLRPVRFTQLRWSDGRHLPPSARCADCLAAEAAPDPASDAQNGRHAAQGRRRRDFVVPPLYEGATLDSFVLWGTEAERKAQGRVLRTMKKYAAKFPDVPALVLLKGNNGTGKGHLTWAVARAVVAKKHTVTVVKFATMIRELRASWRTGDGPSEEQQLRTLRTPDLLVVDEVSRHAFYGDNVSQHLYDVVNERMEQRHPVLLTSDESVAGIKAILGPALIDRLEGEGGTLDFTWRSFRTHGKHETRAAR